MRFNDAYQGTRALAAERPEWVPILRAAYELAGQGTGRFAAKWVLEHAGTWAPGLRPLVTYGILSKSGESTRGGSRSYYVMPDRPGVARALAEL